MNMLSTRETNNEGDIFWINSLGLLHRENGPAVERINGNRGWYINGKRHRENGPAIEYGDGDKSWYLDDIYYTKEQYIKKIRLKKIQFLKE